MSRETRYEYVVSCDRCKVVLVTTKGVHPEGWGEIRIRRHHSETDVSSAVSWWDRPGKDLCGNCLETILAEFDDE